MNQGMMGLFSIEHSSIFSRIYKSFPEITDNSSTDSVVAYNFFTTTWTRSVSEMIIAKTGLKERIFGEFIVGPGQKSLRHD